MDMMEDMGAPMGDDSVEEMVEEPSMSPEQFVATVTASENLAAEMDDNQLNLIAQDVLADFDVDKESMAEWFTLMNRGISLAKLAKEEKTYPFERASNVKYPLITSAALQFNARAYPAIVPSGDAVRVATFGKDPQGQKAARGERISAHMSYQLNNQIEEWEEDTDNLLVQLPIVGTMVRKVWYDPVLQRPRMRLLPPGAFIVNNKVRNLSDAPRCSEEITLYPSEIRERIMSGQYVEWDYDEKAGEGTQDSHELIEQHRRIDLDEDGYPEPYIVTVHTDTQTVVRIVADFDESTVKYQTEQQMVEVPAMAMDPMTGQPMQVMQMQPQEVVTGISAIERGSYFVAYKFMPSMDGGFHGTGLGMLLGDISDTINTIINMMIDAGHMASLGGGFIGSDMRIKGGNQRHRPGEWKLSQATGGEIRNSIVPLTFPGPDATLFAMLGMLIDAGKEISSTQDIMTGDSGGQQQTATATLALIEQGMMVFSAAYKRIFRSLKQEYKLLAKINATTVSPEEYNAFHDGVGQDGQPQMFDPAQDYNARDMDVQPVADPRSVTKMQEAAKAQLLLQMVEMGLVDQAETTLRVLDAAEIADTDKLQPKPDPMQQQMAAFQSDMMMKMAQADLTLKMVDIDKALAQIESEKADAVKTMSEADATTAGTRLSALSMLLSERRNELQGIVAGGMGGMGGAPGNAGGAPRGAMPSGPAAGGGAGGLLGGQGMAGIGQAIAGPNGPMA